MKRKKVCIWILVLGILVAAGIYGYCRFFGESPEEMQGGTLVYERDVICPDGQEC